MKSGKIDFSLSRLRGFFVRQSGSATVEFVVWMPFFLLLTGFFADVANTYLLQASMWSTAMDCTRRMSVGQYTSSQVSPNDVVTACVKKEVLYPYKFSLSTATVTATYGTTDDSIEMSIPIYEAGIFGVFAVFGSFRGTTYKLDVKTTMRAET